MLGAPLASSSGTTEMENPRGCEPGRVFCEAKTFMKSSHYPGLLTWLAAGLLLTQTACNENKNTADPSSPPAKVADADNTARNVRDRKEATLTPGDQSNTPADRELTQKIRKALVMDISGFSTAARNVKIITVDGKVTLRGPVKTDAEKIGIVALARQMAGEGNVDDQLEIKANP
jgi:osmotically-inducible protein OsmY